METLKRLIPLLLATVLLLGVYWWQAKGREEPEAAVTTAPSAQTTEPVSQTTEPVPTQPTTAPPATTEPATLPTDVPVLVPTEPKGEWPQTDIYAELKEYFYQKNNEDGTASVNYFNRLLWADFEKPEDVNLWSLFYDQDPEEGQELTEAEKAFLGIENKRIVTRISAQKMDAVLMQCVGLTLEETNKIGIEQLRYFADTDCYYLPLGDVPRGATCHVAFNRGWVLENGTYVLKYEIPDANKWIKYITIERTEDGIRVLSNTTRPRQMEEPYLEPQKIRENYYSRDSQLFVYYSDYGYGSSGPSWWKEDLKYRCIMRHKLQEGALYEYCESTDSIKLITEGPVKEHRQSRKDYYYILQDAPDTIIRKNRETGEETEIYTSARGDIENLGYYSFRYGFDDEGELVFIEEKSRICKLLLPEQEVVVLYEDPGNVDAIVVYNKEQGRVEFRDMKWMFWNYYFEKGELKGPL